MAAWLLEIELERVCFKVLLKQLLEGILEIYGKTQLGQTLLGEGFKLHTS
jgi:hypothetical protein